MVRGAGRNVGARYQRRRRRYLEYGLVVVLAGILVLVMLARIAHLQGHVETFTLRANVDAMRTAVVLAGIRRHGRPAPGSNPVDLLDEAPAEYGGVAESVNIGELAPGVWQFDKGADVLLYRTRYENTQLPENLPGRVLVLEIVIEGKEEERLRLKMDSK